MPNRFGVVVWGRSLTCRWRGSAGPGSSMLDPYGYGPIRRVTCALLGFALSLLCFAEDAPGPGLLRPLDHTVVPAGPLSVVARTAGKTELRLDGKAVAALQPAPNVLTATLNPTPGRHVLAIGDQTIHL